MANRGVKKKTSRYTNSIRIRNKVRRLNKHLSKHPNDPYAKRALSEAK